MASAKPIETLKMAQPIAILQSDQASLYSHVHPLFVVSTFILRFKSIIEDPISSLTSLLLPLSIAQVLYVVSCLPPVGHPAAASNGKGNTGRKKNGGHVASTKPSDIRVSRRISTAILSVLLALLAGTPIISTILILFGAPLTTSLLETILCGAHLSILAGMPLVYTYGVDSDNWMRIGALMVPIDEVYGASIGTFIGAWFGAIPIPLDWDRDWQKWPVTIIAGAYAGWAVGKYLGRLVLYGRTIDLST